MCGIIYCKKLDGSDARKVALARYNLQKLRGQEGFGFLALQKGILTNYARAEEEDEILKRLKDNPCDELIFHHRYPTSTPNFAECAHPIMVSHPSLKHDYYLIHNGVIFDEGEYKDKHDEQGFKYATELTQHWISNGVSLRKTGKVWNDSETLAIELAIDLDRGGTGVYCRGSIAFIMLQTEKDSSKSVNLFWGRNTVAELQEKKHGHVLTICSEGDGEDIPDHMLNQLNYATGEITRTQYQIGFKTAPVNHNRRAGFQFQEEIDDEAVVGSLCGEWDSLEEELNNHTNSAEREDEILARMKQIEEEIHDIDEKYEQSEMENAIIHG